MSSQYLQIDELDRVKIDRSENLAAATAIGYRLSQTALWSNQRCNWLGSSMELIKGRWQVVEKMLGANLYNGTAGIALFMAHLYRFTNDRIIRKTANGALNHALSHYSNLHQSNQLSFYTGQTGVAYAAYTCGLILEDEKLVKLGQEGLLQLRDRDPNLQGIDLLGGLAGAIPVLLYFGDEFEDSSLIDHAVQCGDRLLNVAEKSDVGLSWRAWPEQDGPSRNLLGFSHGTAGIAWALETLFCKTGETRFRSGSIGAIDYEQHWFDPKTENWPDFRGLNNFDGNTNAQPGQMLAWCHGAPGVALSRLSLYQMTQDDERRVEALVALTTTGRSVDLMLSTQQSNLSLCHGLGGNAATLLYGSEKLRRPDLEVAAQAAAQFAIDTYHRHRLPYPGGVQGAGEVPGLFLGIAGTGYFLLRMYAHSELDPILIFDPHTK